MGMKLYYVECGHHQSRAYVLAEDSAEAYGKLKEFYDEYNWFFKRERDLVRIRVLADSIDLSDINVEQLIL